MTETQIVLTACNRAAETIDELATSLNILNVEFGTVVNGINNRLYIATKIQEILGNIIISTDLRRLISVGKINCDFQDHAEMLVKIHERAVEAAANEYICGKEALRESSALLQLICAKCDAYFNLKLNILGTEVENIQAHQEKYFGKFIKLFALFRRYNQTATNSFKLDYISVLKKQYERNYRRILKQMKPHKMDWLEPTRLIGNPKQSNIAKLTEKIAGFIGASYDDIMSQKNVSTTSLVIENEIKSSDLVSTLNSIFEIIINYITREADFLQRFFQPECEEEINEMLRNIFSPVARSFYRFLQEKLSYCGNVIELLHLKSNLMNINKTCEGGHLMSYCKTVIESYKDQVNKRLNVLFQLQQESLNASVTANQEIGLSVATACRRVAKLIGEVAFQVDLSIEDLQTTLLPIIQKLNEYLCTIASFNQSSRSQSIFLINNYDFMTKYYENCRDTEGSRGKALLTNLIHEYENKQSQISFEFASEEVTPYFSLLFQFKQNLELGNAPSDPDQLIPIIEEVNKCAADQLKAIASSVIQSFNDSRTGMHIVNLMFSAILIAYKKFLDYHDVLDGKSALDDNTELPMTVDQLEKLIRQGHPSFNVQTFRRK